MSARIRETYFDVASGTLVTDIRLEMAAEPRSAAVPAGYRLRFAPSLLSGFQASDSGMRDGQPCWRTRYSHGRTQDGNAELGFYVDPEYNRPGADGAGRRYNQGLVPHGVVDGYRALTAQKTPVRDPKDWKAYAYSASVLTTEMLFTFAPPAYIEARVKLPNVAGIWPAFWMLSKGGAWPPEIDICEHMGEGSKDRSFGRHSHWTNQHTTQGVAGLGGIIPVPDDMYDWITLGLHWTPDECRFLLNDREVRRQRNSWPADLAAYLLLDVAVGGTWPGPPDDSKLPASMLVDYVRVYAP